MKTMKWFALLLALVMLLGLAACGGTNAPASGGNEPASASSGSEPAQSGTSAPASEPNADDPAPAAEPKILKLAESFAYASLDAHKEYYGWYTSIYGVTETLFRVGDDLSVQPLLAEGFSVSEDGKTWTITLKDKAAFSNGTPLTSEMAVRNLQRLGEVNERFAYLQSFVIAADGEKALTVTTPEAYPTLLSDLTAPETAIMDLDAGADLDTAPIGTGPFVIKSFQPEGTVEVVKNTSYWGGDVKLDGVVFYYMQDDESKLMAMQSGEIDGYTSVTAAAKSIFSADPYTYTLTEIPATRLQFYALNENRLDDAVRAAINRTVDCAAIAAYLGGTVSPAVGPFTTAATYGQVSKPAPDPASAKALLEADGYTLGADGIYQKDGKALTVDIGYYAARSLDSIALLMQEQLKNVGIAATLNVQEDPDSTYIATGDFDIALYCMIADKAGDPYYCIDALFRRDSRWSVAGFRSDECEELINKLEFEPDPTQRAALANQIVQMVIDDNAFGFVGLFNKTTVAAPGVVNIGENSPFDFYAVSAATDKP